MTIGDLRRGAFVTIEGGEGGGKSTQTAALVSRLTASGIEAVATREPGGSEAAEAIRDALLSGVFEQSGPKTEALLFAAARIDHLDRTIKPALARGIWIVSDRFHDSTHAYQGALGGVGSAFLAALDRIVLAGLRPDLTLILDLPAVEGLSRATRRRGAESAADRFEKQSLQFHQALRQTFLGIAARDPDRCVVVDASQSPNEVSEAIWDAVRHRLRIVASDGRLT